MQDEPSAPDDAGSQVQGYIDVFKDEGTFEGWARSNGSSRPCIVSIRVEEDVVARAVAEHFRRDLLEAGIGHGHYLYRAKLTGSLPAGEHRATLWNEDTQARIATQDAFAFRVSADREHRAITCEDMLRLNESWDDQTLLANLRCLNLDYNLKVMGYDRFIDICHMYVLDRRPDDVARLKYKNDLATGTMSESAFLASLLQGDERRQRPMPLRSPYDARFPFRLHPRETDVVHDSIAQRPQPSRGKKRGLHRKLLRAIKPLFR